MICLIIGGAASGKSAFAERLVTGMPGKRIYVATMEPVDAESRDRIEKHRAMRAGKGFETIECFRDLASVSFPKGCVALVEDLVNLTANEIYHPNGGGERAVLQGIEKASAVCGSLTIVTGEIFSGGSSYGAETVSFLRTMARINREVAKRSDVVVEIVCGRPNLLKGELK